MHKAATSKASRLTRRMGVKINPWNGVHCPSGAHRPSAFIDKGAIDRETGPVFPLQDLLGLHELERGFHEAFFGKLLVRGTQAVLVPASVVVADAPRHLHSSPC
eukprot:CAMPEP_0172690832 /NCGR_PEP_ID=MMETSP1074-20121228/24145_1 /TAXON_ID=2916 /ORGANISM="Ceratium fusus, Strain PA161109" /LENGTH=103 /DNA_ID=CAMNT_0013510827 /DNA_START=336 /DNA_END=647 /DNA_ORIENTATION=-